MDKVKSVEELEAAVATAKAAGKTIVLANGCFDLLHVGHIRYLQDAKKLGDVLIVAINSDESVRRLKGPGRPVMGVADRAEIVAAIESVDHVTVFHEPDVENLILRLRPHIQAKGTDYTEDNVPEKDVMAKVGGAVRIAGDMKDHSTRDLIRTIRDAFK